VTRPTSLAPARAVRLAVAVALGVLCAVLVYGLFDRAGAPPRDVDQLTFAARTVLDGRDPYPLIGPGRAFDWRWPLVYPMPAVLVLVPIAWLGQVGAHLTFVAVGVAVFAYAVTRHGWAPLLLLVSAPGVFAVAYVQWTPLLAAAAFIPALGLLAVTKPNLAVAVVAAQPTPRQLAIAATAAAAGAVVLSLVSFLIAPGWFASWRAALAASPHLGWQGMPLTHIGGPLLLLAALRWRRGEARALLALACIPHTLFWYEELLLLALVARTTRQVAVLTALSWVGFVIAGLTAPHAPPAPLAAVYAHHGSVMVATIYLPALVVVWRRANTGAVPNWLEKRAAVLPSWIRGRPTAWEATG
jgi:hypothetical protein